ncbi:TPA: hypothetical protein SFZ51_000558 [Campylobacter jejuni]|nr:hypothetical protein [Campylobacter jejuni]HEG8104687.1 hypothetical protein [Campylobacter jejuni]HEG8133545.1 hypothetical protein [Campylobacter jejuni]
MAFITANEVYNYITGRLKNQTFANKPVLANYHITYNTQTGLNPNGKAVENTGSRVTRDEAFNIGYRGYCEDRASRLLFRNQWNVRKAENENIPVTYVLNGIGTASKFKAGDVLTGDAIFAQLLDYKFKWSDAVGSRVFSGLQNITRHYGTTFTDTFQGKPISYVGNKSDGTFRVQLPTPAPTGFFSISDFSNSNQINVGASEYRCIVRRGWWGCRQYGYEWVTYSSFNPTTGEGLVDNSRVTRPAEHVPYNGDLRISGTTRTLSSGVSQIDMVPAPQWSGYASLSTWRESGDSYRCNGSGRSLQFSLRPFGASRSRESSGSYRPCNTIYSYGYYTINTATMASDLTVSFNIPSTPYGAVLSHSGLPAGSSVSGTVVTIPVQRGRTYSGITFQFRATHSDFKDSKIYTLPKIVVGA